MVCWFTTLWLNCKKWDQLVISALKTFSISSFAVSASLFISDMHVHIYKHGMQQKKNTCSNRKRDDKRVALIELSFKWSL